MALTWCQILQSLEMFWLGPLAHHYFPICHSSPKANAPIQASLARTVHARSSPITDVISVMNAWTLHQLVNSLRSSCLVRVWGTVLTLSYKLPAVEARLFPETTGAGRNVNNFLLNLIRMEAMCSAAQHGDSISLALITSLTWQPHSFLNRDAGCQASTQRCHCTSWTLTSPIDWFDLLWLLSSGDMPKSQPEGSLGPFVSLTSWRGLLWIRRPSWSGSCAYIYITRRAADERV